MHPTLPRASHSRSTRRHAVHATLACVAVLQLATSGLTEGGGTDPAIGTPPTVALHYEDLLATEPGDITIFFPRPAGNDWTLLEPTSDDACLRVGRVTGSDPDRVLVIEAEVRTAEPDDTPAGNPDGASGGTSDRTSDRASGNTSDVVPDAAMGVSRCHARVTLTFTTPTERWAAAAAVIVTRVDAPELPFTDLAAVMTSDHIDIPRLGAPMPTEPASMLTLTLHNPFQHAIIVRGVADPAGFEDVAGTIHPHDPTAFDGTYATLEAISQPDDAVVVEAGTDIAFALVLDPERRLADGAGTLTIRPALLVERGSTMFASPFPRVSVAWGNELP